MENQNESKMFIDLEKQSALPDISYKEYFKYKNIIENHKKLNLSSDFPKFLNSKKESPSKFEIILTSNEDKSAVISLVLRELNLWNNETFWIEQIDLERIMRHYGNDGDSNIKNLFSILTYDWCQPKNCNDSYFLLLKFERFEENGENLVRKLVEIADDFPHFGEVVIRILRLYFLELRENKTQKQIQEKLLGNFQMILNMKNQKAKIQILKNLLIILEKNEESGKLYDEIKKKILEIMKHDVTFDSYYSRSLNDMRKVYNEKFFDLIFLIHEKSIEFEQKFEKFLSLSREIFGYHWQNCITNDLQKLKLTASFVNDLDVERFIRTKYEFINREIDEICKEFSVLNEPLNKKEKEFFFKMNNILNDFKTTNTKSEQNFLKHLENMNKKLMFGRLSHDKLSIFEKIAQDSKFCNVIEKVWEKFQLEDYPIVLVLPNPQNKTIVDYLIESESDEQLLVFLSIPNANNITKITRKQKHYMKFFSAQMEFQIGKCFIEHCIDLIINNDFSLFEKFRIHLMNYFEEVGPIEIALKDKIVKNLIRKINDEKTSSKQWTELNKILRLMISYWIDSGRHYKKYREKIIDIFLPNKLIFYLIENRIDDFFKHYDQKINEVPKIIQKFSREINTRNFLQDFLFDIFNIAIRKNQKQIIDVVIKNNCFENFENYHPENINTSDIHHYTALKLLQSGKEGVLEHFRDEWFTIGVIKDFLDSVVNSYNHQYVEMDLSLVSKSKISKSSETDTNIDNSSYRRMKTIEFIARKSKMCGKEILLHPVIETYVNLKSYIYYGISQWNYLAFIFLFLIPFIPLLIYNHKYKGKDEYWNSIGWEKAHYVGIIYLIFREFFQLILEENSLDYYKHKSNQTEWLLIFTSISLSVVSSNFYHHPLIIFLEILFIMMTTISATTLNFLTKDPVYVKSLKKVSLIFLKILHVFIVILWGLAFCIYIVLGDNDNEKNENFENQEENVEYYMHSPIAAFLKVLTMLSGEYSFEESKMSSFQLLFCLLFVVTSFILFNLIVGISFENIEQIMRESRQLNVEYKIKKLIEMEKKFGRIEEWVHNKSCLMRMFQKYKLIRNIEKIYIEMSTRLVYVRVNGCRQRVLTVSKSDRAIDFQIDEEIFDAIREILEKKIEI
ncbi:hypothetical protein PVAND_015731 [Polypedilum vanderplanki]|uniref:Ion transport domain-containing protein n=1 Tax=Polypedilum vanderplanki TaxID=319348 RepID=A0A9J6BD02_POLVA|nr:hypothetical protein PVAND_015731 [Polypedilum vanderplanki]